MTMLSPRTARVLTAIEEFRFYNGYSPAVKDIVQLANLSSTSVATYHLHKLRKAGYINFQDGIARSIVVLRRSA